MWWALIPKDHAAAAIGNAFTLALHQQCNLPREYRDLISLTCNNAGQIVYDALKMCYLFFH